MTRVEKDGAVLGMLLAAAGAELRRDRFGVATVMNFAAEKRGEIISQGQPVAASVSPCPASAPAVKVNPPAGTSVTGAGFCKPGCRTAPRQRSATARGNASVPSPIPLHPLKVCGGRDPGEG